jgi:glycosyltransferase involved in cell wall biosynthesis
MWGSGTDSALTLLPPRLLRLTLVTETFPPDINGVARTLGRWVETFRDRGHFVRVVRPRCANEALGRGLVRSVPLLFYPDLRLGLTTLGKLEALFRQDRPDVVHIATQGPLGLAALLVGRRLRVPLASSFHTNLDWYVRYYGLRWLESLTRAYLRWFHNRTAVTLVPSEATRQRLLQQGFRRVEIWSRGVDAEHFHPRHRDPYLRASLGLGPSDPLLLYVGRLAPEKGLPDLLEAFGNLRRLEAEGARQKLQLALVGDGPLAAQLREARDPGIILPGFQHGEDLARWYASADLFAFPSTTETFGNVILEAQSSGLPVVGFDCPTLRERVEPGRQGLLAAGSEELTAGLLRLCRDPIERGRMGAAARRCAQEQSWEAVFDDLERRYHQLINRDLIGASLLRGEALRWPALDRVLDPWR